MPSVRSCVTTTSDRTAQDIRTSYEGDAIPMLARILSVVDVYDALTTERSYKPAHSSDSAIQELRAEAARGWKFGRLSKSSRLLHSRAPSDRSGGETWGRRVSSGGVCRGATGTRRERRGRSTLALECSGDRCKHLDRVE